MKLKNKKYKIITIILISILLLSNISWFILFKRERTRIKNALIPALTNDYYSNQLILTKQAQFITEFESRDYENINANKNNIKDVPLIMQNPKYPNGCEAASATMLLNYYGINISLDEFINYLPKAKVYQEEGTRFGPNPSLYYAGEPSDANNGWGCFDNVIAKTIKSILKDYKSDLSVIYRKNKMPLSELFNNNPLIIWVTTDYEPVKEVFTWQSYAQKETYTYPRSEHVVVLTGEDNDYYYINDPLKDTKNIKVPKAKLEASFDSLGRGFVMLENIVGEGE